MQLLNSTIHRYSKSQSILATSSGESELYAIDSATAEALHLRAFLLEAKIASRVKTVIYTGSSTAKSIASRHGGIKATRHIQLRYLFLQDPITYGIIQLNKISGAENPADILTKYVKAETLLRLRHRAGLHQEHCSIPHVTRVEYQNKKFTTTLPATPKSQTFYHHNVVTINHIWPQAEERLPQEAYEVTMAEVTTTRHYSLGESLTMHNITTTHKVTGVDLKEFGSVFTNDVKEMNAKSNLTSRLTKAVYSNLNDTVKILVTVA